MGLVLETAPTVEPVTLAEAKRHLRVDHNHEDSLIEDLIVAARGFAEKATRRQFVTATWKYVLDAFPAGYIWMPRPPLQSVTSVTYTDTAGAEQEFASAAYVVDTASEPGRLSLAHGCSWPDTYDEQAVVEITYKAGYGDAAADVPAQIRAAIKLLVGHLYEHREEVSELRLDRVPVAAAAILDLERNTHYE